MCPVSRTMQCGIGFGGNLKEDFELLCQQSKEQVNHFRLLSVTAYKATA